MALLERTSLQELDFMYKMSPLDEGVEPVERLQCLFYMLIEHARRHSWHWSPAQNDHRRLLNTEARIDGKVGNAQAYCRCLVHLVKHHQEDFKLEEDDTTTVRIATFGDPSGAWVAKPSTSGVDKSYRGNIVDADGRLTGYAVLPAHFVVLAYNRIFDPCMGWEFPYPGKTATDWQVEYRAHRMHCSFNKQLVHFAIWETVDIAAWSSARPLMSVEWPPGDEERLQKALPGADGSTEFAYDRPESDKGKMMLQLAFPFMRFKDSEVLRPARIKASGWFLWQAVDLDQVMAREDAEAKAAAKAAKRKAQLERIHGKAGGKKKKK